MLNDLLAGRLGARGAFGRCSSLDARQETRKVQAKVCAARRAGGGGYSLRAPLSNAERASGMSVSAPPLRQGFVPIVPMAPMLRTANASAL